MRFIRGKAMYYFHEIKILIFLGFLKIFFARRFLVIGVKRGELAGLREQRKGVNLEIWSRTERLIRFQRGSTFAFV